MSFDPTSFSFNGFNSFDMFLDNIRIRAICVKESTVYLLILPEENNIRDVEHLTDSTGFIGIHCREGLKEARMVVQIEGLERDDQQYGGECSWKGHVIEVYPWRIKDASRP